MVFNQKFLLSRLNGNRQLRPDIGSSRPLGPDLLLRPAIRKAHRGKGNSGMRLEEGPQAFGPPGAVRYPLQQSLDGDGMIVESTRIRD